MKKLLHAVVLNAAAYALPAGGRHNGKPGADLTGVNLYPGVGLNL